MAHTNRISLLRWRSFAFFFVAVLLWGCSGDKTGPLHPVTGKITVGGKALTRGSISLRPNKAEGNSSIVEPYGDVSPDGTYTIFTNKKPGAPAGKYVVLVTASEDVDPKNPSATPKNLIDPKYADVDKPLLTLEVVANAPAGKYDLTIP